MEVKIKKDWQLTLNIHHMVFMLFSKQGSCEFLVKQIWDLCRVYLKQWYVYFQPWPHIAYQWFRVAQFHSISIHFANLVQQPTKTLLTQGNRINYLHPQASNSHWNNKQQNLPGDFGHYTNNPNKLYGCGSKSTKPKRNIKIHYTLVNWHLSDCEWSASSKVKDRRETEKQRKRK